MEKIITSLLDNDLYKFTMLQAILKLYKGKQVAYKFINRDNRQFPEGFDKLLISHLKDMENIYLTKNEEIYLRDKFKDLFDEEFFSFITNFRFNASTVNVSQDAGDLQISIKGTWEETILWEVPLMALISELFFKQEPGNTVDQLYSNFKIVTSIKAQILEKKGVKIIDFGTRRRYSKLAHSLLVTIMKIYGRKSFIGTSNVYFGMTHNLEVFGTQAHEWIMFHGAIGDYKTANKRSIDAWREVFEYKLGIILSDTYTTDVFFDGLSKEDGELIPGIRQDSGDPLEFTDKTLKYYESIGVSSEDKTIIYSDALSTPKIIEIDNYPAKVNKIYGVGTFLTNDFRGKKPLNMVIKLSEVEGKPTVKLSDNIGKNTGDPEEVIKCKKELNLL